MIFCWVQRGVSGGERKRTNISQRTRQQSRPYFPRRAHYRYVLFGDVEKRENSFPHNQPTIGLDAATSLGLIVSLHNLAQSGHTVVTTIHQPSSSMFLMFDHVLLLLKEATLYTQVLRGPFCPILPALGFTRPITITLLILCVRWPWWLRFNPLCLIGLFNL